ncbi:hypothetical protein JDV09_07275 [Mycobacterium sp. Y57]|uniref:hypothetical protein n=1 Tax=Mycolicibacterium xanthum TaxID=2796469 RepID=UPI001C85CF40|nr:hypothetical protein [Mycolicibacterium xanthum]MBX7431909.1 hypothetical protein [Mycolicibacterium xanthum]
MNVGVFGWLTIVAFVAELVFAAFAFVFVRRLLRRTPTEVSERVGSVRLVLDKVRKGEPMSDDEADFAMQTITDRRSPMAFSIPAAIFTVGCLYVLAKLDQLHGGAPSWGTFIGVLPMLASINMTVELVKIGALKGRADRLTKPALPHEHAM